MTVPSIPQNASGLARNFRRTMRKPKTSMGMRRRARSQRAKATTGNPAVRVPLNISVTAKTPAMAPASAPRAPLLINRCLRALSQPESLDLSLPLLGQSLQPLRVFVNIVLAQGVPHPVVGHHDPPQVGVPLESDPQQVVGLPLVPVGAAPDRRHALDARVVARDAHFQQQF